MEISMENTVLTQADTNVLGNTNKPIRSRNWFLTLNGYDENDISSLKSLGEDCLKYIFQEETGASGNRHLQGVFAFKNPRYFTSLKKEIPKGHWEVCKSLTDAINYCSKSETRTGAQFYKGIVLPKEYDWRPHQAEIINLYKQEPEERKIYWYWDENGNTGKTTIAKYLCTKYKDVLYVQGKSADIKCGISKWTTDVGPLRMAIMGLCRSNEQYVSYEALETMKDGIFFSGKYESGMCVYPTIHVVVFANFAPTIEKLSADRWIIRKIEEVNIVAPDVA